MCLVSKREYERANFGLLFSRNAANIEKGWTCGVTRMHLDRWKSLKEEALQQCDSQLDLRGDVAEDIIPVQHHVSST